MIIKINTPLSLHTQIRQALEQTFFNVGYLLSSTAITQRHCQYTPLFVRCLLAFLSRTKISSTDIRRNKRWLTRGLNKI